MKIFSKRNKLIVLILEWLNPGFGCCAKCRLPWNCCTSKSVNTSSHRGTFATCDVCWNNSTFDELKGYYTEAYKMQEKDSIEAEFSMNHTLEHLLNCVEKERQKPFDEQQPIIYEQKWKKVKLKRTKEGKLEGTIHIP